MPKTRYNSSTFVCTLCKTDGLSCDNKDWQSIERHMINKKHRDNLKLIKQSSKFVTGTEPVLNQRQEGFSSSDVPVLTFGYHTKNINFTDQETRVKPL